MTSSFTTNKVLEKPGNGDYVDTWNVPVNGDMDIIDQAFGGVTSLNATGGSATLTSAQYRSLILSVSGAMSASVTYTIPSGKGGQWIVYNNTTDATGGPWSVIIASGGGGTSYTVTRGQRVLVYSDGTNISVAYAYPTETLIPSGGIILWSGSIASVPAGWYLCNGSNGTPDLRDRFVVGAGSTYAVDATGGSLTTAAGGNHNHGGTTGTSSVVVARDGWGTTGGAIGTVTEGRLVVGSGQPEQQEGLESLRAAGGDLTTGSHSHTISDSGTHTHGSTPPYYALAYIMKA
jgi:hypothetical protein